MNLLTNKTLDSIFLGIAGLIIGSFLNVVIYRLPLKKSLKNPKRSFCPSCSQPIAWYDNIPLISYILLAGTCRNCGKEIGVTYPLVELLNGLAWSLSPLLIKPPSAIGISLLMSSSLITLSAIDLKYLKLPNKIIYSTFALGIPLLVVASAFDNNWLKLYYSAATAFSAFAAFFIIFLIVPKGGFGFGDVKLATLNSMFLGWFGWKIALFSIICAMLAGGTAGILLVALGTKKMKDKIPFGPFLAFGAILGLFLANNALKPWLS